MGLFLDEGPGKVELASVEEGATNAARRDSVCAMRVLCAAGEGATEAARGVAPETGVPEAGPGTGGRFADGVAERDGVGGTPGGTQGLLTGMLDVMMSDGGGMER